MNMPMGHVVQLVWPALEKVLTAHGAQLVGLVLPTFALAVPAWHSMQLAWPLLTLYEPAWHGRHLPADVDCMRGLYVPGGHAVQFSAAVAPGKGL